MGFCISLLTNHIVGISQIRYQDLTPLNILMREYVLAWVRADSPITSSKELIARLKRDPKSVSFGLTPPQIAFWDQTFAKVVQSEEWKKDLDENAWSDDFRGSADTRKHLDAEYELLRKVLAELGVVAR